MNRRRSDKVNRRDRTKTSRADASKIVRRAQSELIIDGYNLMHVSRFKPTSQHEGELRRCREGLLALLASHLHRSHHRDITIVFDSENAPKHLPDHSQWQHIAVIFARNENSADDLIASMVVQHSNPKQLVVVSSDHRVQVAAKRRKATSIDSDTWLDAILEAKVNTELTSKKPKGAQDTVALPKLSAKELAEFREAMSEPVEIEVETEKEADEATIELANPFPDGYFDVLESE